MQLRDLVMAPGCLSSLLGIVTATDARNSALSAPRAIAWLERQFAMICASALAVAANARAAVPVIIRHSDPSLLSLPSPSREIRFDIKAGVSRLVISVICGTCVLALPMSCSAVAAAFSSAGVAPMSAAGLSAIEAASWGWAQSCMARPRQLLFDHFRRARPL